MIHLATDPNAGRMDYRPTAANDKASASTPKRLRGGHAWPFLSRPVNPPANHESGRHPGAADESAIKS
jgi:hypothetical protein